MIQRAASDLIENAIKYAPTGNIVLDVGVDTIEVLEIGPRHPRPTPAARSNASGGPTPRGGLPEGSGLGLPTEPTSSTKTEATPGPTPRPAGGTAVCFGYVVDRRG